MKIKKYIWYIPALYVAFMFGNKIMEGWAHSEEFVHIISLIPFLKESAYYLAPVMGTFDFCVGVALLLNPIITRNVTVQKFIFIWVILWPFVPSSLRYFGGVGTFGIIEVLSISLSASLAYILWRKYSLAN